MEPLFNFVLSPSQRSPDLTMTGENRVCVMAGKERVCYRARVSNNIYTTLNGLQSVRITDVPLIMHLGIQIMITMIAICYRKNSNVVALLFGVLSFALFETDSINNFLARDWRAIGFSRNYFDDGFTVMNVFWVTPLVCNLSLMLVFAFMDIKKVVMRKNWILSDPKEE